jgi:hypothetical protein
VRGFATAPGRPLACIVRPLVSEAPRIEVVGVYRLKLADEWFNRTFVYAYGDGSDEEDAEYKRLRKYFREFLSNVAAVEVLVHNRDDSYSADGFTQLESFPPSEFRQAAYLESYLTKDGTERAEMLGRFKSDPPDGDLRVVFFIHEWNMSAPLETCYGPAQCPAPTTMPSRLEGLIEYEPVD